MLPAGSARFRGTYVVNRLKTPWGEVRYGSTAEVPSPFQQRVTSGEVHDNRLSAVLLSGLKPQTTLLADRAYDADWIRALVNGQGA